METESLKSIVRAVNRWLTYQHLCRRSPLFSEAYLGQPIGEFLLSNYAGRFQPEFNHPTLNAGRPGRPNQLDYALFSPQQDQLVTAIECKWITDRHYPKQLILDDVLRLECVRFVGRHVKRYFLVAGAASHFVEHFRKPEINLGAGQGRVPFAEQLLPFSRSGIKQNVSVVNADSGMRKYYRRFEEAYGVELPKTFTSALIARTISAGIAVYLWQVGSVKNRAVFSPADAWPA